MNKSLKNKYITKRSLGFMSSNILILFPILIFWFHNYNLTNQSIGYLLLYAVVTVSIFYSLSLKCQTRIDYYIKWHNPGIYATDLLIILGLFLIMMMGSVFTLAISQSQIPTPTISFSSIELGLIFYMFYCLTVLPITCSFINSTEGHIDHRKIK